MNLKTTQPNRSRKITACLAILALLVFVSSASAQLTVTTASQLGPGTTLPFTPTWTVNTNNDVLLGLTPTSATGNFGEYTFASSNNLTRASTPLSVVDYTTSAGTNICMAGTVAGGAGQTIIYTLPAATYGQNITNITVYGAWVNSGRDAQNYTISYTMVGAPGIYIPLTSVSYVPSNAGSHPDATRVVINDATGMAFLNNALTLKFDFTTPTSAQENGAAGYTVITAQGTAATTTLLTYTNQTVASAAVPPWTLEANSLIYGMSPSSSAGSFTAFGCGGVAKLTDGAFGVISTLGNSAAGGSTAGTTLIYTLTNNYSPNGSYLTNIVVYSGWQDSRDGQFYNISYSTVVAPSTFIPITQVYYNPAGSSGTNYFSDRVGISNPTGGPLATNVQYLKFDFSVQAAGIDNGASIYAEIIVQGTNTAPVPPPPSPVLVQDTLPAYAETVVGDSVVFTATCSNSPPTTNQWLFISSGVTNVLANQTNTTLTLNNVQLTNSGSYTLKAYNATNNTGLPTYSTAAALVVSSPPAAVGNVILLHAGQVGLGYVSLVNTSANFTATWAVSTNNDLILGSTSGSGPGTFVSVIGTGTVNFGNGGCNANPAILTDGSGGYLSEDAANATQCAAGPTAGQSITYTLPSDGGYGYDMTNITVYGGWPDTGRFEQKYQALYSTVANPTTFISLGTFDYLPTDASGWQSATRTMLVPVSGALAQNVYAVQINWNISGVKNNYEGYSEIVVQGTPSATVHPVLTQDILPTYAETVVGDQVVYTAAFGNSPAVNLQWQFLSGGTTNNLAGATTSTLTLNNVQLTNSGSYRLMAVNATNSALFTFSSGAPLVVSNAPAAVNGVIVNYAGQTFPSSTNFFPAWPVDTSHLNLVNGFATGTGEGTLASEGDFTGNGNYASYDPGTLSDGIAASMTSIPNLAFCACGTGSAGQSVTYSLVTNSTPFGLELTNITVFGGWSDGSRNEQKYQVLYSTMQAPASFVPLLTADYNPADAANQPSVTRTTLVPATGVLAHNVAALKINWNLSSGPKNGWEGYSEILVGGTAATGFAPALSNDISPSTASDVVGSQLIMTAGFIGATSLQWQKNGTNIPGATTSTLTLNNLQLTNAGVYTLVASNSVAVTSSSGCTVTVNAVPAPVANIVTAIAAQTSLADVFAPTWNASALAASLIYNVAPSIAGHGDFTAGAVGASLPPVLTDGTFGTIDYNVSGTSHEVTCIGSGSGSPYQGGQFVIYNLTGSANGYDITNIMTAGDWSNSGRDQQAYTVYYATAANTNYFIPLTSVNYNPTSPSGYSATRATITATNGVLASNVVALQFDMRGPAGENGYSGYSEIAVYGSPSATPPAGPVFTITTENQTPAAGTAPSWVIETPNLIPGSLLPSKFPSSGVLWTVTHGSDISLLSDGTFGNADNWGSYATCGPASGFGSAITFTNATGPSGPGWILTNIVVYSGWLNYFTDGQFYSITYSTPAAPTTFLPLTGISYEPPWPNGSSGAGFSSPATPSANRVAIAPASGQTYLATNVYAVKFDFSVQGGRGVLNNIYCTYAEIVLQGSTNQPVVVVPTTLPTMAPPRVSGGSLILTGTGGTPANAAYIWLTTTNLAAPVWTTNFTGTLDGAGNFSNSIPTGPGGAGFFKFLMP